MRTQLLRHLCCPECRGGLRGVPEAGEVEAGVLTCECCGRTYPVEQGIPILLPERLSNAAERSLRRDVSIAGERRLAEWRSVYDRHHFRALAEDRLRAAIERSDGERARALDVGIGWGCVWLPFSERLDLVGLDFSLESLLLLRHLYEREGARVPDLVCGSLSAIPLTGEQFDVVNSTQVYQHIPDPAEIESSFETLLGSLVRPGGTVFVDNLNYEHFRPILVLKRLRHGRRPLFAQENAIGGLYLRYHRRADYAALMRAHPAYSWSVEYTETLMHPGLGLTPASRGAARLDRVLSRTPLARLLARQITLVARRDES